MILITSLKSYNINTYREQIVTAVRNLAGMDSHLKIGRRIQYVTISIHVTVVCINQSSRETYIFNFLTLHAGNVYFMQALLKTYCIL